MTDQTDIDDIRQMLMVISREALAGRDVREIARIAIKRFGGVGEFNPDQQPLELEEVRV